MSHILILAVFVALVVSGLVFSPFAKLDEDDPSPSQITQNIIQPEFEELDSVNLDNLDRELDALDLDSIDF
jgi:hypothetical protein